MTIWLPNWLRDLLASFGTSLITNAEIREINELSAKLKKSADRLSKALSKAPSNRAASPMQANSPRLHSQEKSTMSPLLQTLADRVTLITTVADSATEFINGSAARQQAAIDQALANGATAEQLAPIQAEVDALKQSADALSAAIAANTPTPNPAATAIAGNADRNP